MSNNNRTNASSKGKSRQAYKRRKDYREADFNRLSGKEDISRRAARVKDYNLGAGRHQVVVFPHDVHYQKDGIWQDIDNTLEERMVDGARMLCNRSNSLQVALPAEHANGSISVVDNGRSISWRFAWAGDAVPVLNISQESHGTEDKRKGGRKEQTLAQRVKAPYSESAVEYTEIAPGIHSRFLLQGRHLKQDIILDDAEALDMAAIEITTPGAHLEVDEHECMSVVDNRSGEILYTFSAPYTHDAIGRETIAHVRINATAHEDTAMVWYDFDDMYLAKAVFPLTIDPLVKSEQKSDGFIDNYVSSKTPTTVSNMAGASLHVCSNTGSGTRYSFLHCPGLPKLDSSCTVTKAYLQLYLRDAAADRHYIGVREVTGEWDSSTITYNNMPGVGDRVLDYITVEASDSVNKSYSLDISNLVRKWYTEPESNHGVRLESMTDAIGYVEFQSSDYSTASRRPQFIINYLTNAGLSTNTQYDEHKCGRAGSANVNLFNGNLVVERPLTGGSGSRMPVSISAYYNACNSDVQGVTPMGLGWSLNCDEYVGSESLNNKTYYYLEQGDGSRRYFESSNGSTSTYKDMDGLSLTLTVSSTNITIKDKQDNKSTYVKLNSTDEIWRIQKATNALNENVTYSYSGGLLSSITDPSGRSTEFTYTGGMLSEIRDAAGDGVQLTVSSTEPRTLNTITDDDDVTVQYTYTLRQNSENESLYLMSSAKQSGNEQLDFTYTTTEPYRLSGCASKGIRTEQEVAGSSCTYTYGDNVAMIHDTTEGGTNKWLYYYFNDAGNVVSMRDDMGNALYASFPSTNLPNHPSEVSKLQRIVKNLFPDHGFESNNGYWQFSREDGAQGDQTYSTSNKRIGTRSVQLNRTSTSGRLSWYTSLSVEGGKYYTASVYAKGNATSGELKSYIRVNNSAQQTIVGDVVTLNDEWKRVTATFYAENTETFWFSILTLGGTGTVYLDCAQLEVGESANRYNILENGNFSFSSAATGMQYWTGYDENTDEDTFLSWIEFPTYAEGYPIPPEDLPQTMLCLNGSPDKTAGYYQELPISGNKDDVYVVGGWAQGYSKPIKGEERRFCIRLAFKVNGTYENAGDIKWCEEWTQWQYAAGVCIAPANYTGIRFDISYQRNVNRAQFCDFALYKEEFGQSYDYDSDGNILSATTLAGTKSYATYDAFHNMTSYRQPGRSTSDKYTMYWGTNDTERKKHLLNNIKTPEGVVNAYLYDEYGNKTLSRTRDEDRTIMMQTTAEYSAAEGHNYLTKQTDSRGNSTEFVHDPEDGTLTSTTMPNGQQITYQYDSMKRLTSVQTTAGSNAYKNDYAYDAADDHLKSVRHNTTSSAMDVEYTFEVDDLGNPTTTKVGSQVLSSNVYSNNARRRLERVEFGNGGKVRYMYDNFDRVIGIKYDELDTEVDRRYVFVYGANGEVSFIGDNNLHCSTEYERDTAERIARITCATRSPDLGYDILLEYDGYNNVSKREERIGDVYGNATTDYTMEYTYDKDNRPTEIKYDESNSRVTHTYDALGRASQRKVYNSSATSANLSTSYTYLAGAPISGEDATSTTPLVASITQNGLSFAYTYDAQTSNLTSVRHITGTTAGSADKYTYYVYDALGQLVRVNDQTDTAAGAEGTTWVYEYDFGGNILAKKRYGYQTGNSTSELSGTPVTTAYAYTDSNWKDKVTSIGGQTISYDAVGNTINDGEWTYTRADSWRA